MNNTRIIDRRNEWVGNATFIGYGFIVLYFFVANIIVLEPTFIQFLVINFFILLVRYVFIGKYYKEINIPWNLFFTNLIAFIAQNWSV